eukprot:TRINITY_DN4724_c0_g1_i1.p1 TRINITY_DN4724_c0_g1~~TRINITY_DN4724_c0_g1_i1.p1  ORF type:complete len:376 (-),score=75.07 TRINITY_DN4724_c0_g1_i1:78-1154(-)
MAQTQQIMNDLFGSDSEDEVQMGEGVDATLADAVETVGSDATSISVVRREAFGPTSERFFVKASNIVGVQPLNYHERRYDVSHDTKCLDKDGEIQTRRPAAHLIRWRGDEEQPETNTRIVKWSDGSYSLVIGDEYFVLKQMPLSSSSAAEQAGEYVYASAGGTEGVYQHECKLTKKLVFQPATVSARKYQTVGSDASSKPTPESRIKMYSTTDDPERLKRDIEAKEESMVRSARQREAQQQKIASKSNSAIGNTELNEDFLEEDADEDDSRSRRKRTFNDEDSDDERDRALVAAKKSASTRRAPKKAAHAMSDDDDDDDLEQRHMAAMMAAEDEESDDDTIANRRPKSKKKVVESDED